MATPEGPRAAEAAACRIVVVVTGKGVGYERDVVGAMQACPRLESNVIGIGSASDMLRLSMGERIYRSLDRLFFGRRRKARPENDLVVEAIDLAAAVSAFDPCAIVDLTGTLSGPIGPQRTPMLTLEFEGQPARFISEAVRRRLGTPQGTARVSAHGQTIGTRRQVFAGECFIDHRSLVRSIDLIVCKVPTIVQAALARMSCPPMNCSTTDRVLPPPRGVLALTGNLASSIFRRLLWRDQWQILVFRDQTRNGLKQPWITLKPDPRALWADPFLVVRDECVCVFFEELSFATGKGRISLIEIDWTGRYGAPVAVLERPWHLSYPFVFEWPEGST